MLKGREAYILECQQHWDRLAQVLDESPSLGTLCYRARLQTIYANLVPPGSSVLELGCGIGDLLDSLHPTRGVGVDCSSKMCERARARHPRLDFHHGLAETAEITGKFDFILLSDLLGELWDVRVVFERLHAWCHAGTRLVMNYFSCAWKPLISLLRFMGMATPTLPQNWIDNGDVDNLLYLTDFDVLRHQTEILVPLQVPILASFCNRYLAKVPPFRWAALANVVVARSERIARESSGGRRISIVVPARNEEDNIPKLVERIPSMGAGVELIFVEGGSVDRTWETIERVARDNPNKHIRYLRQPGKGKGDAVRVGFAAATGDVLMILDADMTVAPEDLPQFYAALVSGKGELINGVRLVYPMEKRAMRFFNLLGNRFFSWAFSWLIGQTIKDTLCGTKVMYRHNYLRIAANRNHFGEFDPFGDFDLLFGAARLVMKIVDMPIRYRERTYGDTNIARWKHGMLLLRMVIFAARRLKFV